jgi:long-chain acyl-CoA synthetase
MKFIGIFCKNRPEWSIVDIGCLLYNIVSIPLYDTLGDENISYVLNHTNLTTCFVNQTSLNSLKKTKDFGNLKKLVCFDDFTFE